MANNLPTIQPFDAGSNPSEAWRYWREDFEDYLEALKYGNEPEKTKTSLFRHVCGEELKKQLRAFDLQPIADGGQVSLKQILDEFDKYFLEYQNEIFASFKFLEMKQEKGEKFSDYYSRLRCAVVECNYGQLQDRMLRDKIIQGLSDKPLQERLIRETSRKSKTLLEVVTECKTAEHSKAQASEMNENKCAVDAIKRYKNRDSAKPMHAPQNNMDSKKLRSCKRCGKTHEIKKCPAYGTICRNCNGKNHWSKMCKRKTERPRNFNRVNAIEEEDSDVVYIGELKSIDELDTKESSSVWLQEIIVNGNKVEFKLDTGSQVNLIPKTELLKWKVKPVVKKCKTPVLDYSDNIVPMLGGAIPLCPPAWDSFFCWPPTEAGSTVSFPCNRIFPFLEQTTQESQVAVAYRHCNEDGFWSEGKWTNYTECEKLDMKVVEHPISPLTISYVIFVGSIISLVCLLVTLFIFCYFKTLQCSRIRVHRNLVLSLILHAVMMLAIALPGISASVDHLFRHTDWLCKVVLVLKMYAAMTCIHWMFVEGLLLHSSITVSVFQREPPFRIYYAIGWGIPVVCVGTWSLFMFFSSSNLCWRGYGQSPFVWFVTGPMIVALVVNAVFLVNIIRILVTKLRTSVSIEIKQVKKAMKATALLFPLLGITHLLFCINPRDDANLEHIYMLVNALLQSSQGIFVAVLYCFLNSEVQSVLAAAYTRFAQKRDPRRSVRSSRGSRMLSTTTTSLSPEILPNGSSGLLAPKVRFALLHKKSNGSVSLPNASTPLKTLPEEGQRDETAFVE